MNLDDLPNRQALEQEEQPKAHVTAVIGTALLCAPPIALLCTVTAMIAAFSTLRETGGADPNVLAGDISRALWPMMIAAPLGVLGLVFALVAIYSMNYRRTWFFYSVIMLAIIHCFYLFPLGLIIATILAATILHTWSEFKSKPKTVIAPSI